MRMAAVGLVLVLGTGLSAADYIQSHRTADKVVLRNSQGKGSRKEEFQVKLQGEEGKRAVEIDVAEQQYSGKEIRELFRKVSGRMEGLILGKNKSLDRIEYDMELLTKAPDEPVEISWELSRYDVMNIRGELQRENLVEEGTLVELRAVLTYSENEEEQAMYECTACVYPRSLSTEEEKQSRLKEEIQKQEKDSRTKRRWKLPDRLLGKEVSYYKKMNSRGLVLIVMAVIIGILLYVLGIQNQGKEKEEKKRQMLLDYPEIVNKMTLFIGAGMTVKRAWRRVVEDYERQKGVLGRRYAYEEMKKVCHEMESGVTEAESYEKFGRRCDIQVYIRFGALLSQNLRKGTKGLTQLLKQESLQAFEERKARAKRLGEEAGTKLLLPMFLMLAVVLVIVVVPAFLSVQI